MKRKTKIILSIAIILVTSIVSTVTLVLRSSFQIKQNKQQARDFIGEIVTSIVEQTSFYKDHADQRALKNIQHYDTSKLTDTFEVSLIDIYWGDCFQYRITFDNQISLILEAHLTDDGFTLGDFSNDYLKLPP